MEDKKKQIIKAILNDSFKSGACHIGSSLSCCDILVDLYYKILKKGDIFIFGKASGVATLYAILEDKGIIKNAYKYLKKYPLVNKEVKGCVWSGGSLGMGLGIACGIALGNRKKNVYVLLGDGDLQEGSTFESALFARHHNLTNLNVIVDCNNLQALGATKDILGLSTAIEFYKNTLPIFQCIKTVKGDGVEFMRNRYEWHYKNLSESQLEEALDGLA